MENSKIKFKCVFLADILGFKEITHKDQAKKTLETYYSIASDFSKGFKDSKILLFSDSLVIGFMEIDDAISFSKLFFNKTFENKIPIRGAIGVKEFNYTSGSDVLPSLMYGEGLVLSSFSETYHIKGHTCLLICEDNPYNRKYDSKYLEKYTKRGLPKGYLYFLVKWWEDSTEIKQIIDERTHGLSCEDIIYLEKTNDNLNYFKDKERMGTGEEW